MSNSPSPVIALLTDFGLSDHYVGSMKGAILTVNSNVRMIDISHDVNPQNIRQGAFLLWASYRYFPRKTIFVCVIDPGVGTERRILAVRAGFWVFVTPDNGILDSVLAQEQIREAVQIYPLNAQSILKKKGFITSLSSTFHGRDLIAPAAAAISLKVPLRRMGPAASLTIPPSPFVGLSSRKTTATVLNIDRFGNVVTSIRMGKEDEQIQQSVSLQIGKRKIRRWARNYAEGSAKEPFLIVGSNNLLEISLRNGSAADILAASYGSRVQIVRQ